MAVTSGTMSCAFNVHKATTLATMESVIKSILSVRNSIGQKGSVSSAIRVFLFSMDFVSNQIKTLAAKHGMEMSVLSVLDAGISILKRSAYL